MTIKETRQGGVLPGEKRIRKKTVDKMHNGVYTVLYKFNTLKQ